MLGARPASTPGGAAREAPGASASLRPRPGEAAQAQRPCVTRASLHPLPTASPKAYGCPACGWVPLIPGGSAARPLGGAPGGRKPSRPGARLAHMGMRKVAWAGWRGAHKASEPPPADPTWRRPGASEPFARFQWTSPSSCPLHCWARRTTK